ncbi:oligogalacturonate lyase [Novosphingobium profundi]|uniref:oligogalacturonate lyase family protein n=1 Tax=Novosphingobium profundi TaxID=1774954 RepID=UPI001BDAFA5C|nr:oligogalacturonate lyase family protein [Novosphingobium profundi]MBT0669227.1 oligogalacturonate lyase [Novosphingobium profundi]
MALAKGRGPAWLGLALLAAASALSPPVQAETPAANQSPAPRDWIDPRTGHRVVQLSHEGNSSSLYFNYNAYTPQNDKMAIVTPAGIAAIDLATFRETPVLAIAERFRLLFTGHTTRNVYYETFEKGGGKTVWAVPIDGGTPRKIAAIASGDIQTINADETLLGGVSVDGDRGAAALKAFEKTDQRFDQANYQALGKDGKPLNYADAKEVRMDERLEAKVPMSMFVIDVKTGQRRTVHASTDWLNHLQFSPTDPGLLMFCHEGPWQKVDRMWLLRIDRPGAAPVKIHTRTMNMEIAGHEWFSEDGKTIWYDLQTPRGQDFWVAGYDIATGHRTRYHLARDEWSVHFNRNADGSLFSGDGGGPDMVAHARDGKWLYLFTPHAVVPDAGIPSPHSEDLIQPGTFTAEKLVDMARQDYRLEPNGKFSPDGKWLIFRGNMFGESHVYAVELARSQEPAE